MFRAAFGGSVNSLPEAVPAVGPKLDTLFLYVGHWAPFAFHA
jgi:hypothetical protein